MSSETMFEEFRQQLRGQPVTERQLAGNSLSVWIGTAPDQSVGFTVWFEPSWHILGAEGVIAGSRQAQDEDEPSGWQAVGKIIDLLVGQLVEDVRRDAVTGDLELVLSGGFRVRSFVTDPRDDFLWRIRDLASNRGLSGSPGSISVYQAA
jgi:hypothetical protein